MPPPMTTITVFRLAPFDKSHAATLLTPSSDFSSSVASIKRGPAASTGARVSRYKSATFRSTTKSALSWAITCATTSAMEGWK